MDETLIEPEGDNKYSANVFLPRLSARYEFLEETFNEPGADNKILIPPTSTGIRSLGFGVGPMSEMSAALSSCYGLVIALSGSPPAATCIYIVFLLKIRTNI